MKIAVLLLLFFPALAFAEVHKCMTDTGKVTYTEIPCATGRVPYDAELVSISESSAHFASLVRGANGNFKATGSVNYQSADFIVDTGASLTTLSGDFAYRLGLRECTPQGTVDTANGQTYYCRVTVSKLNVAGFEFHNVTVSVNPTMRGDSLFGNDLLRQFKIEQLGNVLKLSR